MKINNYFKSIAIVLLILSSLSSLHSQSLKKLGVGLNEPVLAACSDSIGNIYAVCRKDALDSIKIFKYDKSIGNWSLYAKNIINASMSSFNDFSCFTLKNNFYLNSLIDSNHFELYEINQNAWSRKAKFTQQNTNFYQINSMFKKNNNNFGVFYGNFDTINQMSYSNIVLFDGNSFSSLNYNKINGPIYDCEILYDTIFIISSGNYFFQKINSGIWSDYFTQWSYISSDFSFSDSVKYLKSYDFIHQIEGNKEVQRFQHKSNVSAQIFNSSSFEYKKDLLLINKTYNNNYLLLQKTNYKTFPIVEDLILLENTMPKYFFKSNDNKIYIFCQSKIFYDGVVYDNIVEIVVDSLENLLIDTIVVKQFEDKNKNFVYDNNDELLSTFFIVNNEGFITDLNGGYNYFQFSGISPELRGVEYNCLKPYTSANILSRTNMPNVTKDTVFIPYIPSVSDNFSILSISLPKARILDTITLKFKVDNKSCINNNGSLNAELKLNPNVQFISSSPSFSSKSGNTLNFSLTNLYNSQSREIVVKIVYPLNQFSINDVVKHYLKITPSTSDMDSTDNRDSIMQRIVYSYDPNAKFSLPEGRITSDLRKIKYTIHFQNEGNDDARNVTIIDTINLKMPVYSFQMIGATHPYSVSIQPGTNIVTWQFNNINLKPKSENEEKSKGYLVFEANVRGDLRVGDSIRNKAYIYFDYNEPIITNYAVITRVEEKGNGINVNKVVGQSNTIEVYPNPTSKVLNIKNLKNENVNFEVFNSLGQSVLKHNLNLSDTYLINCENLSKGIYFIMTTGGEQIKFIIQ